MLETSVGRRNGEAGSITRAVSRNPSIALLLVFSTVMSIATSLRSPSRVFISPRNTVPHDLSPGGDRVA